MEYTNVAALVCLVFVGAWMLYEFLKPTEGYKRRIKEIDDSVTLKVRNFNRLPMGVNTGESCSKLFIEQCIDPAIERLGPDGLLILDCFDLISCQEEFFFHVFTYITNLKGADFLINRVRVCVGDSYEEANVRVAYKNACVEAMKN